MKQRGLRVTKNSCLEKSANHEGSQIGSGWYGRQDRPSATEVAAVLYQNWYDSPGHNANMLDASHDGAFMDGLMTVVEYYDGKEWYCCAVLTVQDVSIEKLPDELR